MAQRVSEPWVNDPSSDFNPIGGCVQQSIKSRYSSCVRNPFRVDSGGATRYPGFGNPYSWEGTEIGKMGAASSRSRLSFFFATFFFLCGRCGWCAKVWSRELDSRLPGRSGPSRIETLIGRTIKPRLSDGPWAGFGRILRCCPLRRTSIRNSPPPVASDETPEKGRGAT